MGGFNVTDVTKIEDFSASFSSDFLLSTPYPLTLLSLSSLLSGICDCTVVWMLLYEGSCFLVCIFLLVVALCSAAVGLIRFELK